MNWRDSAACAGADTEEFYAIDTGGRPAQPVVTVYCRPCPVRNECLEWALDTGEKHGILGGLTPEQRAGLKKKSRRAKAVAAQRDRYTEGREATRTAPGSAANADRGPGPSEATKPTGRTSHT